MSKTSKLLAVSALALAAGFFGTTQLQAGQVLPGDIIIAQGAGGSGGAGDGAGSAGSAGSDSGSPQDAPGYQGTRNAAPPSNSAVQNPTNPADPAAGRRMDNSANPRSPTAAVPARCQALTNAAERQACINSSR